MVVVGAINVDLVVPVPRLPAPGETVAGPSLERYGGGKGANAAVAAARAGARVRLVGAVGDDDLGADALAALQADGVDVGQVRRRAGTSTGAALIAVDPGGDNQIAVAAGANATVEPADAAAAVDHGPPGAVVVVSTELPTPVVRAAAEAAAAASLRCVFDPGPVVPGLDAVLAAGPLVTPNLTECRQLAARPLASPQEAARTVAIRTGAPVVVTMGAGGVLVVTADGDVEHRPARRVVAVDSTGAGDTFTGVLAAWLAAGAGLDAAVDAALVAASLSVTAAGARTAMPSWAAIRAALG